MTQNKPFIVTADHAGVDTTGYRFVLNGAVLEDKPVRALAAGKISFTHPGLPRGTYHVEVSAYNADGDAKSAPVIVVMTGASPAAPINIQIIVVSS